MPICTLIDTDQTNPESIVDNHIQQLADKRECLLLVSYPFEQYWLESQPVVRLLAIYSLSADGDTVDIEFTVTESSQHLINSLRSLTAETDFAFPRWCHAQSLPVLSPDQPLPLLSLNIPKPWGQEIWYTGIEQRGVAAVGYEAYQASLPYILSALPERLCAAQQRSLILLKVLDPLPEEVLGDLYFELHQEKREVYVVTHIDKTAWPAGEGGIRFGFNQDKRRSFASEADFRAGFAEAVKRYEVCRREVDVLIDAMRVNEGYGLNEPVSATVLSQWLSNIPDQLAQQEKALRADMDAFTETLPLLVGDVVKVPCLTPHSLQHGVRTVEFQTPVYERLILSFAQKVLTQQHWDIESAVELMSLEPEQQQPHLLLYSSEGVKVERIVDFDDFQVQRITLVSGVEYILPETESYGLLMAIDDGLSIGGGALGPERAVLLPRALSVVKLVNTSPEKITFLLAYPD